MAIFFPILYLITSKNSLNGTLSWDNLENIMVALYLIGIETITSLCRNSIKSLN